MTSRKTPKIFKIENDMYPYHVVFYVGPKPSDKVVGKICRRYALWNGEGRTPTCGHGKAGTTTFESGCFVWIRDSIRTPDGLGSFVHEMFHVLSNASHAMGCYMDKNTDEFHAYYAGWIAKEFLKKIQ